MTRLRRKTRHLLRESRGGEKTALNFQSPQLNLNTHLDLKGKHLLTIRLAAISFTWPVRRKYRLNFSQPEGCISVSKPSILTSPCEIS
jgi:hypothetical protein